MENETNQYRKLFLIDAIGAAITALLLWQLIGRFPLLFGVPLFWVRWLSRIAIVYSAYSLLCYIIRPRFASKFLKTIATANIIYCAIILLMIVTNFNSLSALAIAYFIVEIGVIGYLAYKELKTVKKWLHMHKVSFAHTDTQ